MSKILRCIVTMAALLSSLPAYAATNTSATRLQPTLEALVTEHWQALKPVGLGVIVMQDGIITASITVGEKKYRSGERLSIDDKWHIGSITKSFTATTIARLVERGVLDWDTTVGEVLGGSMNIRDSWKPITIEQLLTHTSGASSQFRPPLGFLFRTFDEGDERAAARKKLVIRFMKNDPISPPGSAFMYSNGGFLIAGVMAEKLTGKSWETLIREEIFEPLDIRSGGFGVPQGIPGEPAQPLGHKRLLGFTLPTDSDPTLVIGPAGSIHISLPDLMTYANDHLVGEFGEGTLVKTETWHKLHTPVLENYAFGWVINSEKDLIDETIIWHNGSNGHWDALLALLPASRTIIAITSNDGRFASTDRLTRPLLEKILLLLQSENSSS